MMWRLEVSEDNQTWTVADERSTLQPITYYRRRIASFGSPEDSNWEAMRHGMTWLQKHSCYMAIAIRVEAIASRLETMASRFEA